MINLNKKINLMGSPAMNKEAEDIMEKLIEAAKVKGEWTSIPIDEIQPLEALNQNKSYHRLDLPALDEGLQKIQSSGMAIVESGVDGKKILTPTIAFQNFVKSRIK
ncbi:MAG: hypothetical protein WAV41_02115 [Microgenomates group bacterium]